MTNRTQDSSSTEKLSLFDACGMAIGGMVGGGIFAVLGVAVEQAGNAAFLSFTLAGLLALITGISYSRLTLDFDEPGGSFSYLEEVAGARTGGTASWFLLLGYIFTISLYAYTFGAYAGRMMGLASEWNPYVGGCIILILAALNLVGVRESGLAEDVLVYGKVAILLLVAGAGAFAVQRNEALPVFETDASGVLASAALIFVAFEGFQLLTYDYDDIVEPQRNLPKAIWISIPVVILLYALITFVTTGSLSGKVIGAHKETVLAYVAEPVLGRAGFGAVLVAAVLSTASAINATLFASSRLARRITRHNQLPRATTRWVRAGTPVPFILGASLIALLVQFVGNLNQITTFSSLVFLLIFAVVNAAALWHHTFTGWVRIFPALGGIGCSIATVLLAIHTYRSNPTTLWIIVGIAGGLAALRATYVAVALNDRDDPTAIK